MRITRQCKLKKRKKGQILTFADYVHAQKPCPVSATPNQIISMICFEYQRLTFVVQQLNGCWDKPFCCSSSLRASLRIIICVSQSFLFPGGSEILMVSSVMQRAVSICCLDKDNLSGFCAPACRGPQSAGPRWSRAAAGSR